MIEAMITRPGHTPLITPVAGVFSSAAGDNDSLKDSERKRAEHQGLAHEFLTRGQHQPDQPAQPPPATDKDCVVTLGSLPPIDIQIILTYGYDPRNGTITLQKFTP